MYVHVCSSDSGSGGLAGSGHVFDTLALEIEQLLSKVYIYTETVIQSDTYHHLCHCTHSSHLPLSPAGSYVA